MQNPIINELCKIFNSEIARLDSDLESQFFFPPEMKWNAIQRCLGATDLALAICDGSLHGFIKDLYEITKKEIEKKVSENA